MNNKVQHHLDNKSFNDQYLIDTNFSYAELNAIAEAPNRLVKTAYAANNPKSRSRKEKVTKRLKLVSDSSEYIDYLNKSTAYRPKKFKLKG